MIGISAIIILCLIFLGMGIPLAFLTGALVFAFTTGLSTGSFGSTAYFALESFSLLAVPLFMLAGLIIERSGIGATLIDLGERMLKKIKGGMGATIPVVSCLFGALCGSALATASTMCTMLGPRLEEKGWNKAYVYALIAVSSPFGYMIPPNMNAIIYAKVANASVADLFLATIIPGCLWAGLYLIINRIIYVNYYNPIQNTIAENPAAVTKKEKLIDNFRLIRSVIPAFLMPFIILGGIYSGVFTATEAGAVACLYGIIAGIVIFKAFKFKDLFGIFSEVAYTIGILLIIFPFTMIFTRIMITNNVPQMITDLILSVSTNRLIIILIINIVLFISGFFLDPNILLLVYVPLLIPTATAVGISITQLAVIIFVAIGIGAITPPMAMALFVCARLGKVPIGDMVKVMIPYIVFAALPVMLLVSYVPWFSEFLPSLLR